MYVLLASINWKVFFVMPRLIQYNFPGFQVRLFHHCISRALRDDVFIRTFRAK